MFSARITSTRYDVHADAVQSVSEPLVAVAIGVMEGDDRRGCQPVSPFVRVGRHHHCGDDLWPAATECLCHMQISLSWLAGRLSRRGSCLLVRRGFGCWAHPPPTTRRSAGSLEYVWGERPTTGRPDRQLKEAEWAGKRQAGGRALTALRNATTTTSGAPLCPYSSASASLWSRLSSCFTDCETSTSSCPPHLLTIHIQSNHTIHLPNPVIQCVRNASEAFYAGD